MAPAVPGPTAPAAAQPGPEYHRTVVAPMQLVVGVVVAAAVLLVLVLLGLWPLGIAGAVVVLGASGYVGALSVGATASGLTLGQGRGDRDARVIERGDIASVAAVRLTWRQYWGFDAPGGSELVRYAVRPGPGLLLTLRSGDQLRITAPDPAAALAALGR